MRTTTGTPDFWGKNSISPESLVATKPLTKEPEDSGYEIATREEKERGPGNEVEINMTVNSTRDFIPPEPFEGQNYKPRYARPSALFREELLLLSLLLLLLLLLLAIYPVDRVIQPSKKQAMVDSNR